MTPSAAQLRAARAWLGWSLTEAASFSGVPAPLLSHAERGAAGADQRTLLQLRMIYEKHGLRFIGQDGIGRGLD